MKLELRVLTPRDGEDVYNMLQEIPREENGFQNTANGLDEAAFQQWLITNERIGRG